MPMQSTAMKRPGKRSPLGSFKCFLWAGTESLPHLNVGQVVVDLFEGVHCGENLNHQRVWLRPDFGQIALLGICDCKGQGFDWWSEGGGHAGFVATGIDPVPAVLLKEDRVQAM